MTNIKRGQELLAGIVEGLRREQRPRGDMKIGTLEVVFVCGVERYVFGLIEALDVLASDKYWDERGNWSEAERVEVRTI